MFKNIDEKSSYVDALRSDCNIDSSLINLDIVSYKACEDLMSSWIHTKKTNCTSFLLQCIGFASFAIDTKLGTPFNFKGCGKAI